MRYNKTPATCFAAPTPGPPTRLPRWGGLILFAEPVLSDDDAEAGLKPCATGDHGPAKAGPTDMARRSAKLKFMFRGLSWIRRAGVALLLLASLSAGVIALPHAEGADDVACSPIAVAHDESAHSIAADSTRTPADGDHCFLCHSLRSFYPAFDKFQQHYSTPRTERLHVAPADCASAVAWTLVPGRAPPA